MKFVIVNGIAPFLEISYDDPNDGTVAALHESGFGIVSRVTPVHTAVRNCTRDEGRPFEIGNQVLICIRTVKAVLPAMEMCESRDYS